jgi:hypothetical protein
MFVLNENSKKTRNGGANQQVSTKDGMGGEGDLEVGVVGHEMQVLAKNVDTLVTHEIVQEQVQIGGDVGEASTVDAYRIEVDLEKTILMIEIQKNVVPILVSKEENTNEDVEPHAQIDGNDILNFLYNLLPHPSFQVDGWGLFCQFFCGNTFVNYVL